MAQQRNPSQTRSLLSKCRSRQPAQGPSGPSAGEVQGDGQRRARHEAVVIVPSLFQMEQKRPHDDGLDIPRRIYHALCGQYPDQFIALCDAQGRLLARHDGSAVSTTAAAAWRN